MAKSKVTDISKEVTEQITEHENRSPIPNGVLVIIGGKENKGEEEPENRKKDKSYEELEVLRRFVELIGKENPIIEVVTTASSLPEEVFPEYRGLFKDLGVNRVGHIHHTSRKQIMDDPLLERVQKADGVFFSGGDQLLLTSIYGGTSFLTELKVQYIFKNLVIAGTSAGAMAMSTPMIYAGSKEVQQLGGEIKITTGLEFLRDVCIDTHFVDRGRFIRLAQVIATNPTCIGVGIEEDTAIVVRKGLEAEVIGSGVIIVIEGFEITDTNISDFGSEKPVSIHNLKVHLMGRGEKFLIPQISSPHR